MNIGKVCFRMVMSASLTQCTVPVSYLLINHQICLVRYLEHNFLCGTSTVEIVSKYSKFSDKVFVLLRQMILSCLVVSFYTQMWKRELELVQM